MKTLIFSLLCLNLTGTAWAADSADCVNKTEAARVIRLPAKLVQRVGACATAEHMTVNAHRGAGTHPENTMAAFREAIRQGADTIELDLQITKDGVVVVTHDMDLRANQCLGPDGKRQDPKVKAYVRDMTLKEVKRFDCGSLTAPGATPVPGEQIATLAEAMELLKQHKNLRFNIEIKYPDPKHFPPLEEYIDAVIQAVEKTGVDSKQFFFQSFQHESLAILKRKRPQWEISPLVGGGEADLPILLKAPYALKAKMVTPHYNNLTPEIVAQFHRDGIKVIPWTANSEEEMRKLIRLGVDGIITDHVDTFMKIKRELCGS